MNAMVHIHDRRVAFKVVYMYCVCMQLSLKHIYVQRTISCDSPYWENFCWVFQNLIVTYLYCWNYLSATLSLFIFLSGAPISWGSQGITPHCWLYIAQKLVCFTVFVISLYIFPSSRTVMFRFFLRILFNCFLIFVLSKFLNAWIRL